MTEQTPEVEDIAEELTGRGVAGLPLWEVTVTLTREVAAERSEDALAAVTGPIRRAFGGEAIGTTDLRVKRLYRDLRDVES